jgi:hypothetical protein
MLLEGGRYMDPKHICIVILSFAAYRRKRREQTWGSNSIRSLPCNESKSLFLR